MPREFELDNHQSNSVLALLLREDLGLNSFLTDDSSTCVPTTLNPAGWAANLSGFFQSPMFIGDDISYENSWNLLLS